MPWQSKGARVHARGEDDHLRHTVGLGAQQCLVEEPGANDDRRRRLLGLRRGLHKQLSALFAGQPFGERIGEKRVITDGFLGAHRRDQQSRGRYRSFGVIHTPIMPMQTPAVLDICAARPRHDWATQSAVGGTASASSR